MARVRQSWRWIEVLYRHALKRGSDELERDKTLSTAERQPRKSSEPTIEAAIGEPGATDVSRRVGPYEVLSQIGAGGMGHVFRARDAKLSRDVAIKVLPSALIHDPERLARFRREAQLLASLNHPNIAIVHGLEEPGDAPCLVMELIPGQTLSERLSTGGLAVEDALRIGLQIADALVAAHRHGIAHRDVKPANIKVTPEDRVKVLDFGLAKSEDSRDPSLTLGMTQPGSILGTPGYMSPEQLRGEPAGQAADVWAFGCVLYELLTGRQPFPGSTFAEIVAAVIKTEPDWSLLPASVPKAIRDVIGRCLEKIETQRISIAEVRKELAAAQQIHVAPASGREQAIRTIAVFPFTNSSGDAEMEYLSDGIAEREEFLSGALDSRRGTPSVG